MSDIRGIERQLIDISPSGKLKKWDEYKRLCKTVELAVIDSDLPLELKERARRIGSCADMISFRQSNSTGAMELDNIWLCRERLCSLCQVRLSMRRFANMTKAMAYMDSNRFLFLTLTVRNCKADELRATINEMRKNFIRMYNQKLRYREFKTKKSEGFAKGYYCSIETSYNEKSNSYHPHIHVMIDIKSCYQGKDYINMNGWRALWKEYMNLDYVPQVHAKMMKKNDSGGLLEITKYLVKPSSYITWDDLEYTAKQFEIYHRELSGIRMTATGGTFREAYKTMQLDEDLETADLVHGDGGEITEDYTIKRYCFNGQAYELVAD